MKFFCVSNWLIFFYFSYDSKKQINTRPRVVQTGTTYIKKSSYSPIVKHSTTNLNLHTHSRVNNRVYRRYGGYGGYGGYTGLYGGLGLYGVPGYYGGYGNGGVAIIDSDHFNQNIANTEVNIVNNFNDNHVVSNVNDNVEVNNFNDNFETSDVNDNFDVDVVNDSFNDDAVSDDSFSDDSFSDGDSY
jgi:hypothetical protein